MMIKKLADNQMQSDISNQLLQRVMQIEGDLQKNRNHDENIRFMEDVIRQMDAKIVVGVASGENISGFEKLKVECEAWISRIYNAKESGYGASSEQ